MSFVAFPLRLENGFLRRVDEPSAVLALIEIMARTPHGSWGGSSHFGLRDYSPGPAGRPELPKTAVAEVNQALSDLGIHKYEVESITREPGQEQGSDVYAVSLRATGEQSQVFRIPYRE